MYGGHKRGGMGGRGGFNMGRGGPGGGRGFGGPRGAGGPRGRGGRGGRGGGNPNMNKHIRKIFIGGLNRKTTDETLKEHFSQYGELTDSVVMKDSTTEQSRGFGFVTYATDEEVDACQLARPHNIDGRTVETKRAIPRDAENASAAQTVTKLFVGVFKEELDADDLRTYFGQYGNVTEVKVIMDKETGKKKGFGFVDFDDYDPVDKIICKALEQNHEIKGRRVDVNKAIKKEEMSGGPMGGGPMNGGRGRGGMNRGGRGGMGAPYGGESYVPGGFQSGWGNDQSAVTGGSWGGNGQDMSGGWGQTPQAAGYGGTGGFDSTPAAGYGAGGGYATSGQGFGSGYGQQSGGGAMRSGGNTAPVGGRGGATFRPAPYSGAGGNGVGRGMGSRGAPGGGRGGPLAGTFRGRGGTGPSGGFRGGRGGGFGGQ